MSDAVRSDVPTDERSTPSRWAAPVFGLVVLAGIVGVLYGKVLFKGEILAFRDAGHFYYPFYLKVQQEWEAGRWPLWEPEENGGMPLLGNPTSAALYPGRLLYWRRFWSYEWGTRLYTLAHNLLAVGGMYWLLRNWRASRSASMIAGLGYGFGAPILFQHSNIIFLVGAAWVPFGLLAADRWLRLGRRSGIAGLAAVLALQTLGGDPESAYLLGIAAGGYAGILALEGATWETSRRRGITWAVLIGLIWIGGSLAAAYFFPDWLWWKQPGIPLPRPREIPLVNPLNGLPTPIPIYQALNALGALVSGLLWIGLLAWIWRRSLPRYRARFAWGLAGLAIAGALAGAIVAAQLLPVREFTSKTSRSAPEAPHEIYEFSIPPLRLVEAIWPNVFGSNCPENRSWLYLLPPEVPAKPWVFSLYIGGLVLVLGLAALRIRGGVPPWSIWMSGLFVIAAVAALGEYGSPLWWARFVPSVADVLGPHDAADEGSIRFDMKMTDGDGSPYWLLTRLLPGFKAFRFPAKLLTFVCAAMAALAGFGWDRVREETWWRRPFALAASFAGLSALLAIAAVAFRGPFLTWLEANKQYSGGLFGPLEVAGAYRDTLVAFIYGGAVQALIVGLLIGPWRRSPRAGALAVALLAVDLAIACRPLMLSLPESIYQAEPDVLRVIREAEAHDPAPGRFRIHRMPIWDPPHFYEGRDPRRFAQMNGWEFESIQPKYGLPFGVEYTETRGTAELYDYLFFFAPFHRTVRSEALAESLGVPLGTEITYYPRRGYDLWNTRYFVLPTQAAGWTSAERGFASFLPETRAIYPPPGADMDEETRLAWSREHDWQVRRNENAFPRAWVVHGVKVVPPIGDFRRAPREARIIELLNPGDVFWSEANTPVLDLRKFALVESESTNPFRALDGRPPEAPERVEIAEYEPQRVVIDVDLDRDGLVILADVDYPGWTLTIDDTPAPIYRADHLLRGALVSQGSHKLVYRYAPDSFRLGLMISAAGLVAWTALLAWGLMQPRAE